MGVFVKICGLCSQQQVRDVVALGPDAIGFVFWPHSKRYVKPEDVAVWQNDVPDSILKVGVFVDPDPAETSGIVEMVGLDVVQSNLSMFGEAWDVLSVRRWQAVHLDSGAAVDVSSHIDAYLADSYSKEAPGGTGKTCDWKRVGEFVESISTPVILAGGLNPGNVADAIQQVHPWGVDVSSGVETAPGTKDMKKVKDFIKQCRNA